MSPETGWTAYCPAMICVPCTFATINIHDGTKDIRLVIGFINVELSARAHMLLSHSEIDFECAGTKVNYQSGRGMLRFVRLIAIPLSFISISYIIKITFGYTAKSRIHNEWTCVKHILHNLRQILKRYFLIKFLCFFFLRILSWSQVYIIITVEKLI